MKKQLKELKTDLKKEIRDVRKGDPEDDFEAGLDNGYIDALEQAVHKIDLILNGTWDGTIRYGKTK